MKSSNHYVNGFNSRWPSCMRNSLLNPLPQPSQNPPRLSSLLALPDYSLHIISDQEKKVPSTGHRFFPRVRPRGIFTRLSTDILAS